MTHHFLARSSRSDWNSAEQICPNPKACRAKRFLLPALQVPRPPEEGEGKGEGGRKFKNPLTAASPPRGRGQKSFSRESHFRIKG